MTSSQEGESPLRSTGSTETDTDKDDLDKGGESKNYLDLVAAEKKQLRNFKAVVFYVGVISSCLFLAVGLYKSYSFIGTQLDLAKSTIEIQHKQISIDEQKIELIKNKSMKPEQLKELNLVQDREEKVLNSKVLSTGVILTLITVIFAVALTILLNLIKHAFRTENDKAESGTELATPLGNLVLDLIIAIKDKISK